MIRVPTEVNDDSGRLIVTVQAVSIRRALELVKSRYPDGEVRVSFPYTIWAQQLRY
jgi:hypothetical protein